MTIHDLIFVRFPQYYTWFDRKIHFWKFRKAANSADKIIAISEQTKRDIIQFLKVDENKIDVVYQGCHASFEEKPTEEFLNQVKDKFNLPERFLLNVGTIEERKNLLNVVKALEGNNPENTSSDEYNSSENTTDEKDLGESTTDERDLGGNIQKKLEDRANQAMDKAADKVSKKIEEKINQKIDQATDSTTIDKIIDKILELI